MTASAEVTLRARRSGAEPEKTVRGYRLDAEIDWLVTGPVNALGEIEAALPLRVTERYGDACMRLRFGNAVGRFEVPHLGQIETRSEKWTEEHFETMLAELTDIAVSLPFAGYESAALPYDRSIAARDDVLYHAFVYLRHILSDRAPRHERLLPALRAIVREPHRLLKRRRRVVDLWSARRVGVATLRRIAEGRGTFVQGGSAPALARQLVGRVPETVLEQYVEHTLDTPENRFVRAFLAQATGIIETIVRVVGDDRLGAAVRRDARWMTAALEPFRRAAIWEEVGDMVHVPAVSTVLQRRRGYRKVFRHSHQLRLAAKLPLDRERARDLLEVKDIADLYELWCYFVVVDELRRVLGEAPIAEDHVAATEMQLTVPWGYRVRWSSRVAAYYNLSFSHSKKQARRSYSVPLRPDIAIWVPEPNGGAFHLLDAKFKLRRVDAVFSEAGEDSEEAVKRTSRFKRDDLYKMHTYRDAIPTARSARALYPGEQSKFFQAGGARHAGVGAAPLRPGEDGDRTKLREMLEQVLGAARAPSMASVTAVGTPEASA